MSYCGMYPVFPGSHQYNGIEPSGFHGWYVYQRLQQFATIRTRTGVCVAGDQLRTYILTSKRPICWLNRISLWHPLGEPLTSLSAYRRYKNKVCRVTLLSLLFHYTTHFMKYQHFLSYQFQKVPNPCSSTNRRTSTCSYTIHSRS